MQSDRNKLEAVQKFTLKLVSHQWDCSYSELLRLDDVPLLSERRLHLKLARFWLLKLCTASVTFQTTSFSYNRFIQVGWQERTLSGAHLLALTIITTPLLLAALQLGTVSRRDRCVQAVLLCLNILSL